MRSSGTMSRYNDSKVNDGPLSGRLRLTSRPPIRKSSSWSASGVENHRAFTFGSAQAAKTRAARAR